MSEPKDNQQVENQISMEEELAKINKTIESLAIDFNSSLESLSELEPTTQDLEKKMFKLFMKIKRNPNQSEETLQEYDDVLMEMLESKQEILQRQSKSFNALQKLRNFQTNHLVNLVKALENRIRQLEPAAQESSAELATPVVQSSSQGSSSKTVSSKLRS